MQCLVKCFKNELIAFLKRKENDHEDNNFYITSVAYFNRVDLLQIIYSETNEFLDNA